jgi:hypothetical protein
MQHTALIEYLFKTKTNQKRADSWKLINAIKPIPVGKVRRGRRRKQILDDLQEKRSYWNLKAEALDHTLWRTRFEAGCAPVATQTA